MDKPATNPASVNSPGCRASPASLVESPAAQSSLAAATAQDAEPSPCRGVGHAPRPLDLLEPGDDSHGRCDRLPYRRAYSSVCAQPSRSTSDMLVVIAPFVLDRTNACAPQPGAPTRPRRSASSRHARVTWPTAYSRASSGLIRPLAVITGATCLRLSSLMAWRGWRTPHRKGLMRSMKHVYSRTSIV